jgi:hypothetical protein
MSGKTAPDLLKTPVCLKVNSPKTVKGEEKER